MFIDTDTNSIILNTMPSDLCIDTVITRLDGRTIASKSMPSMPTLNTMLDIVMFLLDADHAVTITL